MGNPKIHLRLLGSFAVSVGSDDATAVLSQPKRLALVAWLALTRPAGLHRRDTLCALLWPESSDEKARATLRQLLSVLRRDLSDHAFVTEGDLVGINRVVVSSDAGAVLDALDAADDATAVDSYAGELLPGLHLAEGETFERWFEQVRGDLRRRVTQAAWRLVDLAEAVGNLQEGRRQAERALTIDPEDEAGLRRLIVLQAKVGDRAAALRTQEAFARRLKEDWGTEPDQATVALVERIRAGELNSRVKAPAPRPTAPAPPEIPNSPTPAGSARAAPNVRPEPTRRTRLRWLWLPAAPVAAVAVLLGSRAARTDATLVAGRVLVVPFENHTGDPSLDAMGMVAADWIIQGLQRSGLAEVVDLGTAFLTTRDVPGRTPQSMAALRKLARGTRAGFIIVGAVAKVRDSVEYSARLADTRTGRMLRVLDPIRAPIADPTIALDELRSRFAGAIATETDTPVIPLSRGERPPRLEAYQEFAAGLRAWVLNQDEAVPRFQRAVALDSSFTLAMMWLFYSSGADDQSVLKRIAERPQGRTPFVQAWVDAWTLESRMRYQLPYVPADSLDPYIAAWRRVVRLSPGSENEYKLAFRLLYYAGRPHEAIEILERLDLDKNLITRWDMYWHVLIKAWHQVGDYRTALAAARKGRRLHPALSAVLQHLETENLAALGDVVAVRANLDSLALGQVPGNAGGHSNYPSGVVAAHELEAHGRLADAIALLEWSEARFRERLANDTTTVTRIYQAIAKAYLAAYRGDRWQLAAEARATLEPALFMSFEDGFTSNDNRLFGYPTAVCAEGDSTRIARLPEPLPLPLTPLEEAQIAVCKGDREGAIRALQKQNGVWFVHFLPLLRPLRQDPRFQKWLRPKG